MRTRWGSLILAAGYLAALGGTAHADWNDIRRNGMAIGGHYSHVEPEEGDASSSGGAQIHFYGTRFAFEIVGDYRDRDIGPLDLREVPVSASLQFYLFEFPISPFIMGGGDWVWTRVEGPAGFEDTQSRFGWHAGAGLLLQVTEGWSLEGSYRRVFIEEVRGVDTVALPTRFEDDTHWIMVGLNIHF